MNLLEDIISPAGKDLIDYVSCLGCKARIKEIEFLKHQLFNEQEERRLASKRLLRFAGIINTSKAKDNSDYKQVKPAKSGYLATKNKYERFVKERSGKNITQVINSTTENLEKELGISTEEVINVTD